MELTEGLYGAVSKLMVREAAVACTDMFHKRIEGFHGYLLFFLCQVFRRGTGVIHGFRVQSTEHQLIIGRMDHSKIGAAS